MADNNHAQVAAWFLGPKAENFDLLKDIFSKALEDQKNARANLYPEDAPSIDIAMQSTTVFQDQISLLRARVQDVSTALSTFSVPFFSPRYNGHMLMESTFPSIIGYIVAMMYNPNNVAVEASPISTIIEQFVGEQLCLMLGFNIDNPQINPVPSTGGKEGFKDEPLPNAWGHITCDGSVANLEATWAARNLKCYPFSLKMAIEQGVTKEFLSCSDWELLNLKVSTVLNIPDQLYQDYGISQTFLTAALDKYSVQTLGLDAMLDSWSVKTPPRFYAGTTRHYSWPKGGAIVGIGRNNVVSVPVDDYARMDADELDQMLATCVSPANEADRIPVYAVVVIMGSTEQGAIDPLAKVVALRTKYQAQGLSFVIHCDGAWGGYFASMIRPKPGFVKGPNEGTDFVPEAPLSGYVTEQVLAYKDADSITIDPHKSGYCPYPAGGLCYRDGRMRYLNTWTSPVVFRNGDAVDNIGVYGVEGSKPGAAAVGAFLSHDIIGLHNEGYGRLLGQAMYSCTRFYCNWATMTMNQDTPLIVVPLTMLPTERENPVNPSDVQAEKQRIVDFILSKSNDDVYSNKDTWAFFQELGGDVMINAFACNFMIDGKPNTDVIEANNLNTRIFNATSVNSINPEQPITMPKFFLTSSLLAQSDYGQCLDKFKARLGLVGTQDLYVLINVTMSPWSTTNDSQLFNSMIADFKDIAEAETKNSVTWNSVTPLKHDFVMQGTDKLHLVHLPKFRLASHRSQVIMTGDLDSASMQQYTTLRSQSPNDYFLLENASDDILDNLTKTGGSFAVNIFQGSDTTKSPVAQGTLSNVQVIVQASLQGGQLSPTFPVQMPFYLYGTQQQQHIEHMLLCAPDAAFNQQFNSDQVNLTVSPALSADDLATGVYAVFTTVYEQAMQPMQVQPADESHDNYTVGSFSFAAGASFSVAVYKTYQDATTGSNPLTTGTLALGKCCYVDDVDIKSINVAPSVLPTPASVPSELLGHAVPALPNEIPLAGAPIEYVNKRRGITTAGVRKYLQDTFKAKV